MGPEPVGDTSRRDRHSKLRGVAVVHAAPRKPVCLRHSVWMASCPGCRREHAADQAAQLAALPLVERRP